MSGAVFLIGMMACGKTTLGQALAKAMPQRSFVDLDCMIEQEQGMPVSRIFKERGEAEFRSLEADALRRAAVDGAIVACGGGTPCFKANMDFMLANGTVVWLRADRDVTVRRLLLAPAGQRPLIAAVEPSPEAVGAVVDSYEAQRAQFYRRAHQIFDSSRLETPRQIAEAVEAFSAQFLT